MVQESLTKVARHANGDQATVRLGADWHMLRVDNWEQGRGFVPGTQLTQDIGKGQAGMLERARTLKGRFQVYLAPA